MGIGYQGDGERAGVLPSISRRRAATVRGVERSRASGSKATANERLVGIRDALAAVPWR
jgi:hypothetical protein